MADELMDILAYITKLLEAIVQKVDIEAYSQTLLKELQEQAKLLHGISENSKVTITSIKTSGKDMEDVLRSHGIGLTKEFIANNRMLTDALVQQHKNSPLTYAQLYAARANFASSNISSSQKAEARGEKGTLKNVLDNQSIKAISEEISKKLGLEPALDNTMRKLMMFLGVTNKDNQKKQKNLMDDLVDALGKGRLGKIGQDIFRIVGFMGARWLSQFGQFGKIMGGLFYVAMESFAPILANLLVTGMGKLITWGVTSITGAVLGLGRILVGLAANMGGPLGMFTPGKFRMLTGATQAKAIGGVAAGLGIAAVGTAGAAWAGGEAVDSWKSGKKGNATALGVGAGLMGAGALAGLASLIIPAIGGALAIPLAPIAAGVVALGAAVAGIAFWWKKTHREDKEKDKEEKSWWQNFIDWIKDHWPFGGGNKDNNNNNGPMSELPGGGGVNRPGGKAREYDLKHSKDIGGFKVAPDGSILNFHELTQAQGAKAIEAYQKQDPESFNRVFELVDPKYVQQGSFATDKGVKKNGKFWALSYKGAGQDIEMARKELAPLLGKKSESLVMSGGVASKGGPHHVPKLLRNFFKSHYNQYGEALDLVGTGWNLDEYYTAWQKLSELYGKKGFVVNYENPDGTFAKSRKDMRPGGHFDIKKTRDTRSEGAVENLKVKAQRQNIVSQKMIEDRNLGGGTDAFFDWMKEHKLGKKEDWNSYEDWMKRDLMDGYLKHRGIRRETNEKGIDEYYTYGKGALPGTSKKTGRIDVEWGDPSGNSAFDNMKFKLNGINQLGADR